MTANWFLINFAFYPNFFFKRVRCLWIITTTARNSVFAGIDMMMHLVRHIEGLVVPAHAGTRWQDEGLHGPPDRGFSEAHFNLVRGLPVDFKVLQSFLSPFNKHETLATGLQVANQPANVTLFLLICAFYFCILMHFSIAATSVYINVNNWWLMPVVTVIWRKRGNLKLSGWGNNWWEYQAGLNWDDDPNQSWTGAGVYIQEEVISWWEAGECTGMDNDLIAGRWAELRGPPHTHTHTAWGTYTNIRNIPKNQIYVCIRELYKLLTR